MSEVEQYVVEFINTFVLGVGVGLALLGLLIIAAIITPAIRRFLTTHKKSEALEMA